MARSRTAAVVVRMVLALLVAVAMPGVVAAAGPADSTEASREAAMLRMMDESADADARAAAKQLGIAYDPWMVGCQRDAAGLRAEFTPADRQAWLGDAAALRSLCRRVVREKVGVQPPDRLASLRADVMTIIDQVAHPTTLGEGGTIISGPGATPAAAGIAARARADVLRTDYAGWSAGCRADLATRTARGREAGFAFNLPPTTCDMLLAGVSDGGAPARARAVEYYLTALERGATLANGAAPSRSSAAPSRSSAQPAPAADPAAALAAVARKAAGRLRLDYAQWLAGCQSDVTARVAQGQGRRYEYRLSAAAIQVTCDQMLGGIANGGAATRKQAVDALLTAKEAGYQRAQLGLAQDAAGRLGTDFAGWMQGCGADMANELQRMAKKGASFEGGPYTAADIQDACVTILQEVPDAREGTRRHAVKQLLDN